MFNDKRSAKLKKQQELWVLLGQVTSAQRWNIGMIRSLETLDFDTSELRYFYNHYVEQLKTLEVEIRKKMKEL